MDSFVTRYDIECQQSVESAVLEDSIMHKDRPVTAGSGMLRNFISPLDATVVTRLEAAGIRIIGKTMMDEFGVAGLFANEPVVASCAVSAVAGDSATFALCNDYTGSVAMQAVSRGLYYIHPTYGTVSRYGLIPAVSSMDQIGIVCKTPDDGRRVLSIIAGHDPKDGAMYISEQGTGARGQETVDANSELKEKLTIGIPRNIPNQSPENAFSMGFIGNFDTVDFELEYFDVYTQVMQILCCAEISGNLSRYDGIKYGYRAGGFADLQELYKKSRTEGFGEDAKLSSVVGAMVLSQENYSRYYDKAMRIRSLIKGSLDFDKYDAILLPASDASPENRLALHALPRLCGLPAMTVPLGGGATLVADALHEDILFSASKEVSV